MSLRLYPRPHLAWRAPPAAQHGRRPQLPLQPEARAVSGPLAQSPCWPLQVRPSVPRGLSALVLAAAYPILSVETDAHQGRHQAQDPWPRLSKSSSYPPLGRLALATASALASRPLHLPILFTCPQAQRLLCHFQAQSSVLSSKRLRSHSFPRPGDAPRLLFFTSLILIFSAFIHAL